MLTAPTSRPANCLLTSVIQGSFCEDEIVVDEKRPKPVVCKSTTGTLSEPSCETPNKCDLDSDNGSATTEESTLLDSFSEYDNDSYSMELFLSKLTESEKEATARINYQYDCMVRNRDSNPDDSDKNGRELSTQLRDRAAMMTFRHFLTDCQGNIDKALKRLRASLATREDISLNSVRHCFRENTPHASVLSRKIQKYTGPKGRVFVRGYDKEGRAFLHVVLRNSSEHLKVDTEGEMEAHAFAFEKAIACTEKRTGGCKGDVNLCFDVSGFRPWHVSASLMKQLFTMMFRHQVGRVHKAYAVDAPALFRILWIAAEAVAPAELRGKCAFLSKKEQEAIFRNVVDASEAMPYQRKDGMLTEPLDMDAYFKLPFSVAYDENRL